MRKDVKVGLVAGLVVAIFGAVMLFGRPQEDQSKSPSDSPDTAQRTPPPAPDPLPPADPPSDPGLPPSPSDPLPPPPPPAPLPPAPIDTDDPSPGPPTDIFSDPPPPAPGPVAPYPIDPPPGPVDVPAPDWPKKHVVKAGDTLFDLAEHYYGHGQYMTVIANVNATIRHRPNMLRVGMTLTIPQLPSVETSTAAGTYLVQPGDTLSGIAEKVLGDQSRWVEIYEANSHILTSPDKIRAGMTLKIPEATTALRTSTVR